MPNDLFNPHFNHFPASEPVEEVKFLDFLINLFFLQPLMQLDKLDWFSIKIVTEPFFTNRIILEIGLFIFGLYFLVIDNL